MTCRSRYDELLAAERLSELSHYMDTTASKQHRREAFRDLSGTEVVVISKSADDLRRFLRDSKNPTFARVKVLTLVFDASEWSDGQDDALSTALYDLQDQVPPRRPHTLDTVKIIVEGNFVFTRRDYVLCSAAGSEDANSHLRDFCSGRYSFADIAAKQLRNPTGRQSPYKITTFEKQAIKTLLRIRGVRDVQISGPMEQVLAIDLMTAMKSPAGTTIPTREEKRRNYMETTDLQYERVLSDQSECGVPGFQLAGMLRTCTQEVDDHEQSSRSAEDGSDSSSNDGSEFIPSPTARISEYKSSDLTKKIPPTSKQMRFVLGWEAPRGMRRARLVKTSSSSRMGASRSTSSGRIPPRKTAKFDSDDDMDDD